MSTIKSSAENLTLNADGANNDIIFQSNGTTKATLDQAGLLTATSFAGSGANLTGVGVDGISSSANATAMTIDSAENIGIGTTPESGQGSNSQGLYVGTHASLTSNGAYESVNLSENAYLATAASDAWKYRDTSHAARHEMKAGVHTLKVAASGSADAAITWNTGFEVLNDGKARAKNGLLFGTDTAASNVLDDYEEGTWTPTFTSGGNTLSISGGQTYAYTKVGNVCTVTFNIANCTVSGTAATGDNRITLPFTGIGGVRQPTSIISYFSSGGLRYTGADVLMGEVGGSVSFIQLQEWINSTGYRNISVAPTTGGGTYFWFTLTYLTA